MSRGPGRVREVPLCVSFAKRWQVAASPDISRM